MKKVCIIGHFGFGKTLLNGQTIKTKIVTEALCHQYGSEDVVPIDTHGGLKSLFRAPRQAFKALKIAANVIIMPAHNGLRIYVPLLCFFRLFCKTRKLAYVVIGGWLADYLSSRRILARLLKSFDGIYVETNTMKKALEKQGFKNIYVMPNCKDLTPLGIDELVYHSEPPYKLCTFSRVMKEKGIEDAVDAVRAMNEKYGKNIYELDIYGQVDDGQRDWFARLQADFPEYIHYCGTVPFDKSVEVLKNYFALLFPTYYEGEGFAGTLIDAYSAGLPVIASAWRYNSEIVNEHTGFVYTTGNQAEFINILTDVMLNPALILSKKISCLAEVNKFRTDKVIQVLIKKIEGE